MRRIDTVYLAMYRARALAYTDALPEFSSFYIYHRGPCRLLRMLQLASLPMQALGVRCCFHVKLTIFNMGEHRLAWKIGFPSL